MSDPMTNTEVEDVLSSIRRLVSDDKRADQKAEEQPANDRLVLTPSLRVTDETPDSGDDWSDEEGALDGESSDHMDETEEDHAAEPEDAGVDAAWAAHESEPVLEEEHGETAPYAASFEDGDDDSDVVLTALTEPEVQGAPADADDHADAQSMDADDAPAASDQPQDGADETVIRRDAAPYSAYGAQTLSAKIAALETLIAGRSDQWEPDDAGTDAYAGTDAPTMDWVDAEDDVDAFEDVDDEQMSDHVSDSVEAPEVNEAIRVEDAEEVIAPESLDAYVAPDDDIEAELLATNTAENVEPFMAAAQTSEEAGETPKPEQSAQLFPGEEDVLDEDTLRDLVADIVRQELQGALGERITRNVRKLVRREIHRAIAAQELE